MTFGANGLMTVDPQVLADIIAHRFNDRIQPNVGLLVELYDIVRACECKSLPDISVAYVNVVFRYVVFNPPVGSVWEGKIASSNPEGISVCLSFFRDIFVPVANLPDQAEFDDAEGAFTWTSADEDGGDPIPFVFAQGEPVRFRVCEVKYQGAGKLPLMIVIGSMDSRTAGLGPKIWWVTIPE
jgi:DNA-directed RNA polymerase III subunit RPC8